MKRILYVTGKIPDNNILNDGGDSTVAEFIEALGNQNDLDLLLIRSDVDTIGAVPNVKQIIKIKKDMLCKDNYGKKQASKYEKWINSGEIIAKTIREIESDYDVIIMQHIMCILGLAREDEKILRKTLLLPMFTGQFYIKAGEYVPPIYIQKEKQALSIIKYILSPSMIEKSVLMKEYNVVDKRIVVIPRPIKFPYIHRSRCNKKCTRLLYIGSVRAQKNHIGAICMMNSLIKLNHNIKLFCCGAIQEKSIFESCQKKIHEYGLEEHIEFCGNQSAKALEQIINLCDINISVSNCETFGRGIYEGMAAGLPTVILKRFGYVGRSCGISVEPIVATDYADMAQIINALICDDEAFSNESQKGESLQKELSSKNIFQKIQSTVDSIFDFNE